ncbi:MAG: hypothetical protein PWP67_2507 [Clostridium butyricum]|jgi:uncharacterized protein YutE (UPF0331/DUF86 family)|uniref:DUF86 domain-containing protein n=1 Tax=Clostridium butyricum TaxID=1492 RepID=A0A512TKZ5_CLOBU|nr:hypothetical protein [Clostridium butyricum]ETI91813.1 MAG: hypothetical protein Q607_CBUC00018G0006 [Clostridium butyricum DORA_1]MDK2829687.1 hypothetical protein [Clostridium butyricum]MDU1509607.1 hypothetical protein [Clostridium butyricum]MDU4803100.1 hypothetical protein [Clostridium butyricum]MDU5723778.1 hypothetical protein [Clostridium butyricum]
MSPYYEYKKERLEKKFQSSKDTLALLIGAMKEFNKTNSIFLKRSILGYFQDLTEYIIDMCETFLVMTDNYTDGFTSLELIKRARIHDFFDDSLCDFLLKIVKLRNRYTHDYYKREGVEEDILKCCFSEVMYMDIFLEMSEIEIHLRSKIKNH